MNVEKPYRPSNGTEGEMFRARWCDHCAHLGDPDEGTDGGNDSATTAWFIWPPEDPQQVGHRIRYLGRHKPGGAP